MNHSELLKIGLNTYRALFTNWFGIKHPIFCGFKLTYNCNLRCKMCPFWKRHSENLSIDKIKQSLLKIKKLGVPMIAFEGGEPLLRNDIGEIISFSRDIGLSTNIVTNGVLLEHKKDEVIHNINGILFVSIDGLEKTHDKNRGVKGTFKKAIKGIVTCKDKVPICMNTTITNDNLDEVEKVVELAKELDVASSIEVAVDYKEADFKSPERSKLSKVVNTLIKMKKNGYSIVNSVNYLRVLKGDKKWSCKPWTVINISPEGNVVVPCYVYDGYKGSIDVNDPDLLKKWKSYNWDKLKDCKKCNLHCYVEPSLILSFDIGTCLDWLRQTIISLKNTSRNIRRGCECF